MIKREETRNEVSDTLEPCRKQKRTKKVQTSRTKCISSDRTRNNEASKEQDPKLKRIQINQPYSNQIAHDQFEPDR